MIRSSITKLLSAALLIGALAGPVAAMETTLRGGNLLFTNSRSFALSHMGDPVVGLEITDELSPLIDLGVALSMSVTDNSQYGLAGGMAVARTPLYRCPPSGTRVLLGWGVGLGTSPEIISSDLEVERDLTIWHEVSVDARFRLGPVIVGGAMGVRQLSVIATTLSVGVDL